MIWGYAHFRKPPYDDTWSATSRNLCPHFCAALRSPRAILAGLSEALWAKQLILGLVGKKITETSFLYADEYGSTLHMFPWSKSATDTTWVSIKMGHFLFRMHNCLYNARHKHAETLEIWRNQNEPSANPKETINQPEIYPKPRLNIP